MQVIPLSWKTSLVSMRQRIFLTALLLSVVGVACGAETDPYSCGEVSGCGGDPVGVWKIKKSCYNQPFLPFGCEAATLIGQDLTVTGRFSFDEDGTYVQGLSTSGITKLLVPPRCLSGAETVSLACDEYQGSLNVDDLDQSAECEPVGSSCSCEIVWPPREATTYGTWYSSGTTSTGHAFCVRASLLHVTTLSPGGAILSDWVAVRE